MNDQRCLSQTIGFALSTAIVALLFACGAGWAFSQLGPAEQAVVSSMAAPWFDAASLADAARRESPVPGTLPCFQLPICGTAAADPGGNDVTRAAFAVEPVTD